MATGRWQKDEYMKTIDWEQRRYEIAKEVLSSILSKQEKPNIYLAARRAAGSADILIRELRNE